MATFNGNVTGGTLKLRASASATSSERTTIPNGQALNVSTFTGTGSNEWFSTSYGGYSGYVMARWIAITTGGTAATISTASGPLNIRATPSSSGTISFTAARNSTVRILNVSAQQSAVSKVNMDHAIIGAKSRFKNFENLKN